MILFQTFWQSYPQFVIKRSVKITGNTYAKDNYLKYLQGFLKKTLNKKA